MAGWFESQLNSTNSIVSRNIGAVKQDAVVQGIKNSIEVCYPSNAFNSNCSSINDRSNFSLIFQECPDAAVDAVVEMVRGLNAQQRAHVLQSLSQQGEDQQS